jgi:DNA-binding transcriptional LysR family regulator
MGYAVQWDDRIGRRLKLRDLHIFMTVAQHGSMGRAAKHLAVSQPVVSKAISDLERMLKVQLVDRTAQGVAPTLYGSALLRSGTVVFDDLRRSVNEIETLADPMAGEVRIASSDMLNGSFVPILIERLARRFPRLAYHVLQAPTAEALHQMVSERSVDLALSYLAVPVMVGDLQFEVLFSESLSVVAGLDSKWTRRRKIELAELADEPWCLPAHGSLVASVIARAFHEYGLDMPRHVLTNSVHLWHALIVTGRVLAFATRTRLKLTGDRYGLKALPVDLHIPYGSVGIVTLKRRSINPAAQLFIEGAREVAKSLAQG